MNCQHSPPWFNPCPSCGEFSLPSSDQKLTFFEIFGIRPHFFVDLKTLEQKYYELSRSLHPDKHQAKGAQNVLLATHWAAQLNEGVKTLKNLQLRGEYILELAHYVAAKAKQTLPPALAEEYFEIQEEKSLAKMKEFLARIKTEVSLSEQNLEGAFRDWETAQCPLDEKGFIFFKRASEALRQRAYLQSMAHDLESRWQD